MHKLDALTRILEAEPFEAMIVFARTRQATEELAEKLQARGFSAAAINGDIVQAQRERTIQQLKDGKLDILVATDVAARGLDVERISHVVNFDIPHDTEAYVHRIGRTGRAGRSGEAILFVTPREKRLLQSIERATRQPIEEMRLPTIEAVNDRRIERFKQRISDTLAREDLDVFRQLIEHYEREHDVPAIEIASALARLVQGTRPLLLEPPTRAERSRERDQHEAPPPRKQRERSPRETPPPRAQRDTAKASRPMPSPDVHERDARESAPRRTPRDERAHVPDADLETFRIEVGHQHGVKPNNIVGAIANEAGLDSKHIGRVDIHEEHSFVDLPQGMPHEIFKHLKKVWVAGQQLRITRSGDEPDAADKPRPRKAPSFKAPSFKAKTGGFDAPKRPPSKKKKHSR
jgi:ATP-dependent RNA helicase DeaD